MILSITLLESGMYTPINGYADCFAIPRFANSQLKKWPATNWTFCPVAYKLLSTSISIENLLLNSFSLMLMSLMASINVSTN